MLKRFERIELVGAPEVRQSKETGKEVQSLLLLFCKEKRPHAGPFFVERKPLSWAGSCRSGCE